MVQQSYSHREVEMKNFRVSGSLREPLKIWSDKGSEFIFILLDIFKEIPDRLLKLIKFGVIVQIDDLFSHKLP